MSATTSRTDAPRPDRAVAAAAKAYLADHPGDTVEAALADVRATTPALWRRYIVWRIGPDGGGGPDAVVDLLGPPPVLGESPAGEWLAALIERRRQRRGCDHRDALRAVYSDPANLRLVLQADLELAVEECWL